MGVISSLAGIGGAVLSIAFLVWCSIPLHHAIGTAAAIGVPLSIAGTIDFVATGWAMPPCRNGAWATFICPLSAGIAVTSILVAPSAPNSRTGCR